MSISSTGQMTWRQTPHSECALHLRLDASDPWQLYKEFPQYAVPDPPEFSEGYATFVALLKQDWQVIPKET